MADQRNLERFNVGGMGGYPISDPVGLLMALKTILLGNNPGEPGGPAPGLAMLAGPAKYTLQRAVPKLARFLQKSPTQFYANFGDMPKRSGESSYQTMGTTRVLGPQEAKDLSVTNDFIAGLGPIPTVGSMQSGSFERGTYGNPYKALKRPLEAGDVELRLSQKDYDPNIFRQGGVKKAGSVFSGQREAAAHEGLHGAYFDKLAKADRQEFGRLTERLRRGETLSEGEQATVRRLQQFGMPPAAAAQAPGVHPWMSRSGYDFLNLQPFGPETMEHGMLSTAAMNAAKRARGY